MRRTASFQKDGPVIPSGAGVSRQAARSRLPRQSRSGSRRQRSYGFFGQGRDAYLSVVQPTSSSALPRARHLVHFTKAKPSMRPLSKAERRWAGALRQKSRASREPPSVGNSRYLCPSQVVYKENKPECWRCTDPCRGSIGCRPEETRVHAPPAGRHSPARPSLIRPHIPTIAVRPRVAWECPVPPKGWVWSGNGQITLEPGAQGVAG